MHKSHPAPRKRTLKSAKASVPMQSTYPDDPPAPSPPMSLEEIKAEHIHLKKMLDESLAECERLYEELIQSWPH